MSELDVSVAREEFDATLSRVANGKERIVLTHDGRPVAILAPVEEGETTKPDAGNQRVLDEFAAAGRARREQLAAQGTPPWEAVKDDPAWQQKWDDLLAYFRDLVPPDVTLEEIEADLRETREAIRQERRARDD